MRAMTDVRMTALRRDGATVLSVALAIALPVALALPGLLLLGSAEWVEGIVCTYRLDGPCPGTAIVLQLAGSAIVVAAVLAFITAIRFLRAEGRAHLFFPGLTIIFAALASVALVNGESWGNAVIEFGSLAAATAVLSIDLGPARLLRAAVVAQAVDLATFGAVWQLGQGEANPLGGLIMQALGVPGYPEAWHGAAIAGGVLILAKLALIAFLVRVSPHLVRYRDPVLLAALVVGVIGGAANLRVILFP